MRRPPAARPPPLVPRGPLLGGIAIAALGGGVLALRWEVGRRAARELIVPAPADTTTPRSLGVPYADLQLPSGDHAIHARWVRARPDSAHGGPRAATAVLLFHGNRASLAQQAAVQQVLYRAGISSLVFDYSGFGTSGGQASPGALRADARAAFIAFADSARDAGRRILLGVSLGAAVLLADITDLETGVDGVAIVGAFTSARDLAVLGGRVPRWLAWLVPDLYDNVAAVAHVTRPLLIVHGARDLVFPIAGAERLLAAAHEPKRLVRLDRTRHDEYLSSDDEWRPIIAFIRKGFE